MFTGIIETLGRVEKVEREKGNIHFTLSSAISSQLKIDQSVAHDGACLTVVAQDDQAHTVTAIQETLDKTNLSRWQVGKLVNLERCLPANGRLDGHIVQGHVDTIAECVRADETNGSWLFTFAYDQTKGITVSKGSICINGVSLTVVSPTDDQFSVAIIPYTFEHTSFQQIRVGDCVNIEFDILGKYVEKLLQRGK